MPDGNRPAPRSGAAAATTQAAASGGLDYATILGLVAALSLVAAALALGGRLGAFVDLPSILIVGGGTIAVVAISFSGADLGRAFRIVGNSLVRRHQGPEQAAVATLQVADSVRRGGLPALERNQAMLRASQPFFAKGLALAADGVVVEEIERVLDRELHALRERHLRSAGMLRKAAEVSPAMGLIGTLIGLVQMLGQLDDPAAIGPGMAVALLTTFYGAVLATMVFSPLASKLERNSAEEGIVHQIHVLGCLSIARKENPRHLETQINALLPPAQRLNFFR